MVILAIETSALVASAAILINQTLSAEYTLNFKMTHSQTIMPMIEEICQRTELCLAEIDYIAICSGPGSFTGLRIGAATAKGLAFGLSIPVVPVPTLDALAYNIFNTNKIICPVMDARRQQVYSAFYEWEQGRLIRLTDYMAEPIQKIAEMADTFRKEVIFLGDGVSVHKQLLENYSSFSFAPPSCNMQRAGCVASLAVSLIEEKWAISGESFAPFYLRKSQAEREREERENAGNSTNG